MPVHRDPITPIVENRKLELKRDSLTEGLHDLADDVNRFIVRRAGFRDGDRLHVILVVKLDEAPPVEPGQEVLQ